MNKNQIEKEKNHDVVLFLRIEATEASDEKKDTKYSLRLNVKSGVELPSIEKIDMKPVVVTISLKLKKPSVWKFITRSSRGISGKRLKISWICFIAGK